MSQKTPTKKSKGIYTQGIIVAIGLAVLTAIEYYVAISPWSSAILLLLLALVKGYLVVNYFMHISTLWSSDEEH
jgi:heme/copper-type cytochrome/quinol oxidase subunit 4